MRCIDLWFDSNEILQEACISKSYSPWRTTWRISDSEAIKKSWKLCINYAYDSVFYDNRMFFMGSSVDSTGKSDDMFEYVYDKSIVFDRA